MKSDRIAVLPGPPQPNEINGLECQPGVTAHTDSKGQSGEVSTRLRGAVAGAGIAAVFVVFGAAFVSGCIYLTEHAGIYTLPIVSAALVLTVGAIIGAVDAVDD